jgi:Mor family transcriptional regulator
MNLREKEIAPFIVLEDIPDSLQTIAQAIGIQGLIELLNVIGGITVYMPFPEAILREARNRAILKEFDGSNYDLLASKYGICARQVRNIVTKGKHS